MAKKKTDLEPTEVHDESAPERGDTARRHGGPEGWTWREAGPHGPNWYPPIVVAKVPARAEHLALVRIADDLELGAPLARAGAGAHDELVVEILEPAPDVVAAVEVLFHVCMGGVDEPPTFERAYEFSQSTANRQFANPAWVHEPGDG